MSSYLKSIYVFNNYKNKHFLIEFPPTGEEKFKHLILTGTNGSGKTFEDDNLKLKHQLKGKYGREFYFVLDIPC